MVFLKRRFLKVIALGLVVGLCVPSTLYAKGGASVSKAKVEAADEDDDVEEDIEDVEDGTDEDESALDDEGAEEDEEYAESDEGDEDAEDGEDVDEDADDEDFEDDDVESDEDFDVGDEDLDKAVVADHMEDDSEEECIEVDEAVDDIEDAEGEEEGKSESSNSADVESDEDDYDDCDSDEDNEDCEKPYIEVDEIILHYDNGTKQKIPVKKVMSDGSITISCSCSSSGSYEDSSKTLHVYNKKSLLDNVSKYLSEYSEVAADDVFKVDGKEYKMVACKMGGKYTHKSDIKSGKEKETLNTKVGEMNHTYFGGSFVETLGGVDIDVFAIPTDASDDLFTSEYVEAHF